MKSRYVWIVALVAVMAIAPSFARKDFTAVEGGEFLVPVDMTADASTIVLSGLFGGVFFSWTKDAGLVSLGATGCGSGRISISDDGSTIVANAPNENGICEAAKWLGGENWQTMGSEPGALPCGSSVSTAYDTNNDTAVGLFWRAQLCRAIGGTWDVVLGMAGPPLTSTVPNRPTRGNAITNDGTIIAGWQDSEFGERRAARWVNGVQELIQDGAGNYYGEVIGMNADGSVMWGTSYQFDGTGRGWLFREGKGFLPMGTGSIGVNVQSVPLGASADGSIVIGITRNFFTFEENGWIWTEKKGWQLFDDFLKGRVGKGWQITIPSAISPDGSIIGGRGINPDGVIQAFILDTKASGNPNQ